MNFFMPFRYQELVRTLSGLEKTGMPLIAYDSRVFRPAGFSDDIGIYYFIPKIAVFLNVSLYQAINIFFIGMVVFSLILGLIGSFLVFRTKVGKLVAFIGLCLLSYKYYFCNVYLVYLSLPVAIVPLFLYFIKRTKFDKSFFIFVFFTGLCIGISHFIRAYSGIGVLIFMIFILLFLKIHLKQKVALTTSIIVGILIPILYFNTLLNNRDAYLIKSHVNYKKSIVQHPFWHSVYLGFSFLDNEYGIVPDDIVAFKKVRSVAPDAGYLSKKYELTLRNEVFKLIKEHPFFVIKTITEKIRIMVLYLLAFANIGLILAFIYPKKWFLELAFIFALGFNSLFGILIIPYHHYCLGFIAFATIYGIVSINHAIDCGFRSDIVALLNPSIRSKFMKNRV